MPTPKFSKFQMVDIVQKVNNVQIFNLLGIAVKSAQTMQIISGVKPLYKR